MIESHTHQLRLRLSLRTAHTHVPLRTHKHIVLVVCYEACVLPLALLTDSCNSWAAISCGSLLPPRILSYLHVLTRNTYACGHCCRAALPCSAASIDACALYRSQSTRVPGCYSLGFGCVCICASGIIIAMIATCRSCSRSCSCRCHPRYNIN